MGFAFDMKLFRTLTIDLDDAADIRDGLRSRVELEMSAAPAYGRARILCC
jgi:hypothetical protein